MDLSKERDYREEMERRIKEIEEKAEREKKEVRDKAEREKKQVRDKAEREKQEAQDAILEAKEGARKAKEGERKARDQADQATKLTQKTNLLEFLDAVHVHLSSNVRVELNPLLTTKGIITDPEGKIFPNILENGMP